MLIELQKIRKLVADIQASEYTPRDASIEDEIMLLEETIAEAIYKWENYSFDPLCQEYDESIHERKYGD